MLAPYDPLASNTAMALKPPSAAHWFGTDQLGRDIFSRVLVATRLDLSIAFASVILAFMLGALSGVAAGYFGGWTDRVVGRAGRHHHGLSAVRAGHGHRGGAGQRGDQHRDRHRASSTSRSTPVSRAPRPTCGARRASSRRRGCRGNGEARMLLGHVLPEHHAHHDGADVAHHGLRHPQCRRPLLHRPRRAAAGAGVGHHGRRGRQLHPLRRMVDRAVSPAPR